MSAKKLCQSLGCNSKFSAIEVVRFSRTRSSQKKRIILRLRSPLLLCNWIQSTTRAGHQVQSREDKTPQRAIKNKSKASIATDYSNRCLGFAGLSNVSQYNLLIDPPWWDLATISGETTILIFPFQILSNLRLFMSQTTFANTFVGRKFNFTETLPFIWFKLSPFRSTSNLS